MNCANFLKSNSCNETWENLSGESLNMLTKKKNTNLFLIHIENFLDSKIKVL